MGAALLRSLCRITRQIEGSSSSSYTLSLNSRAAQEEFQKLNAFKMSHTKWLAKAYSGGALKKSKPLLILLRAISDGAITAAFLRTATRSVINDNSISEGDKEQIGFDMIRLLNEQLNQRNVTSWSVNEEMGVRVCVSTVADKDNNPQDSKGLLKYFYKVTVFNSSSRTYKLLGRHWRFYTGDELIQEVPRWGSGVLGAQPVLFPKHAVEYTSCCTVGSSDSYMKGGLQFADISGLEVPKELDEYVRPEDDLNIQMRRWGMQGQTAVQLIDEHIELLHRTIDSLNHAKQLHEKILNCPKFTCDIAKTSFS